MAGAAGSDEQTNLVKMNSEVLVLRKSKLCFHVGVKSVVWCTGRRV